MTEVKFDQSGKIENLDELTTDEVAEAYFQHSQKLFGRAKTAEEKAEAERAAREKAEEEVKNLKTEGEKNTQSKKPDVDSDELKLIARGLSDEEVEEAKSIAKGKDISLLEAIKTKSFELFQENLKEEARKEKAKLGAAKGSGEGSADENEVQADMSREDHQKLFKKTLGK